MHSNNTTVTHCFRYYSMLDHICHTDLYLLLINFHYCVQLTKADTVCISYITVQFDPNAALYTYIYSVCTVCTYALTIYRARRFFLSCEGTNSTREVRKKGVTTGLPVMSQSNSSASALVNMIQKTF
jgi:hypothetical protein